MTRRILGSLLLLWLGGMGLRITILAMPPVIPQVKADLGLSQTGIGILSGLPPILFALAAIPGAVIIARWGSITTLVVGLLLTAAGGAMRGLANEPLLLYATTILMALGIALMQPAMPSAVREWVPHRIGFATAIYTNGLLVGEVLPVALMLPLVLPLVGGGWGLGLAFWSLPVLATALGIVLFAPRAPERPRLPGRLAGRWWPDWRDARLWRLAFAFGAVNAAYFASNGFLPDFLVSHGRADLISPTLTALNLGQIPASLILLAVAPRLLGKRWPYLMCGILIVIGAGGIIGIGGPATVLFAGMIGFSCAFALTLSLAMPAILAAPQDVPRMTAGMLTVSYTLALVISVICGMAWDATGRPDSAFIPILLAGLALCAMAPTLRLRPNVPQAG